MTLGFKAQDMRRVMAVCGSIVDEGSAREALQYINLHVQFNTADEAAVTAYGIDNEGGCLGMVKCLACRIDEAMPGEDLAAWIFIKPIKLPKETVSVEIRHIPGLVTMVTYKDNAGTEVLKESWPDASTPQRWDTMVQGWYNDHRFEELAISLNTKKLQAVLKAYSGSKNLLLNFSKNTGPVLIRPDTDDWQAESTILMPVRQNWSKYER